MLVAGQYPPAGIWRNGGLVGLFRFGDAGVAGEFFEFARGELGLAAAGGDVGLLALGAVVDVDLGGGRWDPFRSKVGGPS